MKKFFTLIAAALFAVGVSAEEVTLWEGSVTVDGWGNQPYMLSDAGVELKDAGAAAGDEVRFYITAASENWLLQVVEGHWGDTYAEYSGANIDLSQVGYVSLTLTDEILAAAYVQQYWGGTFILNGDGGIECTKVTLVSALSYSDTAKPITYNEYGFIAASEFEGLNDQAKVVFTYNYAGEPLESHIGWGVGRVSSNDDTDGNPTVVIATLPLKAAGEASVTASYADIKRALEVTPEGILFNVWGMDGIETTRVKVEAFDVVSDDEGGTDGIVELPVQVISNDATYNVTGQKVNENYKGLVIKNGKKYIQK